MRNLKRALSLALASVMLLGMMVVGTSAASFSDVDESKHNVEAIEVLKAVGVMIGDKGTNTLRPDDKVSRNEMAAVMARLILGTYASESYTGTHPFTDVPNWADRYVAACYNAGIINGTSATTYSGTDNVTAVQAAAMMLRALGYEDLSKGAAKWDAPVAAKANEINLFEGLNGSGNVAMDRNSVAKLALNTLQATMVTTSRSGNDIVLPDGTAFYATRNYSLRTTNYGWRDAIDDEGNATGGGYLQLGEYLYKGKLEKTGGAPDSLGRPVDYKWVYDSEDVCDVLKDARYTIKNNFTGKDLYNTLGKSAVDSIGTGTGKRSLTVYVDGVALNTSSTATFKSALDSKSTTKYGDSLAVGNGTVTEIYISDDAIDVCIINTYGGKVDKVYTAADVKSDEKPYVLVDGMKFETTAFQEDDIVAYTKGKDNTKTVIASMELATPVEGSVTKATEGKNFTVNGSTYEFNLTLAAGDKIGTGNVKNDVVVYLDANRYMIYKGEAKASTDYAYVVSVGAEKDRYDSSSYTYYAKLLLTDGTLKDVTLKKQAEWSGDSAANSFKDNIVTYTEDDGKYKLTVAADGTPALATVSTNTHLEIKNGVAAMKLNNGTVNESANSNTVFLVCTNKADEKYDVYVGFKNVPDITGQGSASKVAYSTKSGVVNVVYVEGANVDTSSDSSLIVIIGDKNSKLVKDGSDEYYEFKAVVDGEEKTVQVAKASVEDSGNVCYQLVQLGNHEKGFVIQKVKTNSKGFITEYTLYSAVGGDFTVVNATGTKRAENDVVGYGIKHSSYADDAQVVYRDEDGNLRAGGVSLIRTDENDTATVVLKKGKIIGVYVQEVAAVDPVPGYVAGDPVPASIALSGTAAAATDINWTNTTASDTSSLDNKTLTATATGVARIDVSATVTFTTATVAAGDNTKVQVYSASTKSYSELLTEAVTKLNAQFAAYAAEMRAEDSDYTAITITNVVGTNNSALSATTVTATKTVYEYENDTNNPTFEADITASDIKRAILEDHASPVAVAQSLLMVDGYNVNVTAEDATTFNVAVAHNAMKSHTNNADPKAPGKWVGFCVKAPEGAAKMKYSFSGTGALSGPAALDTEIVEKSDGSFKGEGSGIAFYLNAAEGGDGPTGTCRVQFLAADGTALTDVYTFNYTLTVTDAPAAAPAT